MVQKKVDPHYLQVTCPAHNCQRQVTLICPYCSIGALHCDAQYIIYCPHCHNQMKEIICSCGFSIKASYIREKQQRLKELRENSNKKKYWAIAITLALFAFTVWFFSKIYEIS